jgi:hypothetical protein
VRNHHHGIIDKARDGRDIALQIEGKVFIHAGVDDGRGAKKQQRVPIGRRVDYRLHRNVCACAWSVLDDNRLPEPLGEPVAHDTRDGIGTASWWKPNDPTQGLRWIGLRPRITRKGRQGDRNRCEMQKLPTGKFHNGLPNSARHAF